jgi:hypothetical protein
MNQLQRRIGLFLGIGIAGMYSLPNSVLASENILIETAQADPLNNSNQECRFPIDFVCPPPPPPPVQGDSFCAIAPNAHAWWLYGTWSRQPLLIWRGSISSISLRRRGTMSDLPWTPTITPDQQTVVYDGEPLEPGDYWVQIQYLDQNGNANSEEIRLSVIDDENSEIAIAIDNIEQQALAPDEMIRQRAQYFEEQNLWLDVFRELEQLALTSPDLRTQLDDYYESICLSD